MKRTTARDLPRVLLTCGLTGAAIGALIVVGSIASPILVLSLASDMRPISPLARVLIVSVGNLVVPALAGALIAYVASPVPRASYLELRDVTRHAGWCASWYVLLALLLVPIVIGGGSAGFGLMAQLFVWPAIALAAAIVTDLVLTKRASACTSSRRRTTSCSSS